MHLTKNFTIEEFSCRDSSRVPHHYMDNVRGLACNLQRLRDHLGLPIHITSGYRTHDYNQKIGGAPKSQHLTASAADIVVRSMGPDAVAAEIRKLIRRGILWQGGVGVYHSFTHYDIRGKKARWTG